MSQVKLQVRQSDAPTCHEIRCTFKRMLSVTEYNSVIGTGRLLYTSTPTMVEFSQKTFRPLETWTAPI